MNDDLNLEISDKLLYSMFKRSISAILNTTIKLSITDFSSNKGIIKALTEKIKKDNKLNTCVEEKLYTPQFIVASINKHCSFKCADCPYKDDFTAELTSEQWGDIFRQAYDLGISFIILSGGEPLLKKSVLKECCKYPKIIFPIFTNINMITEEWIKFFEENRNIIPIINLDKNKNLECFTVTKKDLVEKLFYMKRILFGISITITNENFNTVLSEEYIINYRKKGCIFVLFKKYNDTLNKSLELTNVQESDFNRIIKNLRAKFKWVFSKSNMTNDYIDEEIEFNKGIIHISPCGIIKECEYSVYADMNLQYTPLKTALDSLTPQEENYFYDLTENDFDIDKILKEEDNEFIVEKVKKNLKIINPNKE